MTGDSKQLYRLGGYSWIASAAFFLLGAVLEWMAGPPPATGAEIVAWSQSAKVPLAFLNEALFFAFVALVPATIGVYVSLARVAPAKTAMGCGILAVTIALGTMLLVVQGRLVFPVYGIQADSPVAAELVVALFYGGIHAFYLLLAGATLLLSLAMRQSSYGKKVAYLGMATSALHVAGSYQYALGPALMLLWKCFLVAWFVAVGAVLVRLGKAAARSP